MRWRANVCMKEHCWKSPKKDSPWEFSSFSTKTQLLVPSSPRRLVKKSLRGTFFSPCTKKSHKQTPPLGCTPIAGNKVLSPETLNTNQANDNLHGKEARVFSPLRREEMIIFPLHLGLTDSNFCIFLQYKNDEFVHRNYQLDHKE